MRRAYSPSVSRRRPGVSLENLTAFPLILMSRDSSFRAVVDRAFAAIGHFGPPSYEASYLSTALGMVEAGLGGTILPASVLRMDGGRGLVSRPIQNPKVGRGVGFIQLRGRSLSPSATALLQAIRKACADLFARKKYRLLCYDSFASSFCLPRCLPNAASSVS